MVTQFVIAVIVAALYDFLKDPAAFKSAWGAQLRGPRE